MQENIKFDITFLEELFDEISKIAKEDNVITPDELAILESTRKNIDKFKDLYEKAIEDNIITEEEEKILYKAYKKIYEEPQFEALKDNKFTLDEIKLIVKIAYSLFSA